jgi:tripartite-type tricarboxylate transporter receptor subunit TctC
MEFSHQRQFLRLAMIAAALLAFPAIGRAQAYPTRPVRVIVPFAPAGAVDVVARLITQKLGESLGKRFVVENQGGAGGNIGMGNAAKAAPDGYTILFVSPSYVVNPSLYPRVPYDPIRDFAPITLAGAVPDALVIHPSVPAKTVRELVGLIKANPYKYSYASPGIGTPPHLAAELLKLTTSINLVHVPFSGAGPALVATLAGHTPILFTPLTPAIAMIKEGKVRPLAISASKRSASLPEVPTMEEEGFKDQEADTFIGVLVPAGTPQDIVTLLHREIVRTLKTPHLNARFDELGFEIAASTPEAFAAQIKIELEKWAKVIRAANIKAE